MVVDVTLPGISQLGVDNNAPVDPTRGVTVAVLNSARQVVFTQLVIAPYNSANGDWKAAVDLGPSWTAGSYFVTERVASVSDTLTQTMGRYSGSTFQIAGGKKTYLPRTPLFTGDINGDGAINVLDYNILLNCWNQTGCSPNTSQYTASDLNDDSTVNQYDYNIFLRSEGGVNADCSNGVCVGMLHRGLMAAMIANSTTSFRYQGKPNAESGADAAGPAALIGVCRLSRYGRY